MIRIVIVLLLMKTQMVLAETYDLSSDIIVIDDAVRSSPEYRDFSKTVMRKIWKPSDEFTMEDAVYLDLSRMKRMSSGMPLDPAISNVILKQLESKAKKHALITFCERNEKDEFETCGIYRYSSASQSITAKSTRQFKVPIPDPTRWANPIAKSFKNGYAAYESYKTEQDLKAFLNKSQQLGQETPSELWIGLITSFSDPSLKADSALPQSQILELGLGLGQQVGNKKYGLDVLHGQSLEQDRENLAITQTLGRVFFDASFKAVFSIVWKLGTEIGYGTQSGRIGFNRELKENFLHFGLRPSVGIDLSRSIQLTQTLNYAWRNRLSRKENENSNIISSIDKNQIRYIIGLNIRV
ncbi:MAG: hypothetical protein HRU19_08730 [Pseudobacteriovorax sp.]|nr:hypothetical protein [Pseudobacteriovorax sp.]